MVMAIDTDRRTGWFRLVWSGKTPTTGIEYAQQSVALAAARWCNDHRIPEMEAQR